MAQLREQLLRDVRREGREDDHKPLKLVAIEPPLAGRGIDKLDHRRDRGVHGQTLDVVADLGDRAMQQFFNVLIAGFGERKDAGFLIHGKSPHPLQEPEHPHDIARVPWFAGVQRSHVHFIEPERVRAVLGDHIVGVDDVLQ